MADLGQPPGPQQHHLQSVEILPNDLSRSMDSRDALTVHHEHISPSLSSGRKCYVDPHEAFPQATYYLHHELKRPNYYLQKERSFNKKILIQKAHGQPAKLSALSALSPPRKAPKKRKLKPSEHKHDGNQNKMELDSESDDDEDDSDSDALDDERDHEADDELFSDVHMAARSPRSESYELDEAKLREMGLGLAHDVPSKELDADLSPPAKTKKARKPPKFGAWDGVFVSCLLNIFGVIMFLRLGFVVGQAGLMYSLLIILLSCTVTTLTTLSMAAIATNGQMRAGVFIVIRVV